jgi:hypothetical protein
VIVADSVPWDLLDRLDAAADDAVNVHNDACSVFDERGPQPCSCGIPALLIDAAGWMRGHVVDAAVRQAQQAA